MIRKYEQKETELGTKRTGTIKSMLKLGRYRHYKGGEYRVIGIAKHSETMEDIVVYEALYENEISKLWARPIKMFLGEVEVNGKKFPRFEYIGSGR